MKVDEYFLLVAHSYLRSGEALAPKMAAKLRQSPYDYLNPRCPGKFSLGGSNESGDPVNFFQWADPLRAEGILTLSISKIDEKIASVVTGGTVEILNVVTKKLRHCFALVPTLSPRYRADVEDFIALVEEQENPELLWDQCKNQILEFMAMNSEEADPAASAKELLRETPNSRLWDPLGDSLFRELQVTLMADGKKLKIGRKLSSLIQSFTEDFGEEMDDLPYVYFYKEKDISSEQLVELIEAQPFVEALLEKVQESLVQEEPSFKIRINGPDWKKALKILTPDELDPLVGWVARSVSEICTQERLQPIIPSSQISHWGPAPAELLRIRAREKLQKSGYSLVPFEDPWQFYEFKKLPLSDFTPGTQRSPEVVETLPLYRQTLNDLVPFAQKIVSPFEEAFRLADFILDQVESLEKGSSAMLEKVRAAGFSDLAQEIFSEKIQLSDELHQMLFESEEIAILLSLEISDIFGGMGSWNDQYFSDETLQQEFQLLSDALYSRRNALFQSVINFNAGS